MADITAKDIKGVASSVTLKYRDSKDGSFAQIVTAAKYRKQFQVVPAVQVAAYSSGNCLGGLNTLANLTRGNGAGATLRSVTITDKAKMDQAMDLILFQDNPTGSTFTDKAAVNVVAADIPKIAGIVHVAIADYIDVGAGSAATEKGLDIAFNSIGSTGYVVAVTRGTPTPSAGTTDYTIALNFELD